MSFFFFLLLPSGIKNPVLVANCLLIEAQKGKLSAGRIPPWWLSRLLINECLVTAFFLLILLPFCSFLVGRGAHDWAVSHGIPPCPSENMATSECCWDNQMKNKDFVYSKKKKKTLTRSQKIKDLLSFIWMQLGPILSHPEFSLSAYKRNKRKMELAEKMDAGQNQTKKRRQSSENVSFFC